MGLTGVLCGGYEHSMAEFVKMFPCFSFHQNPEIREGRLTLLCCFLYAEAGCR